MSGLHHFGRFMLDPESRTLCADGVPVSLGATDFRVLLALVEGAGSIVEKSILMSLLGGRRDNVLHVHINALRKVLGNDCIVNQQGRGYRLAAHVTRQELSEPPKHVPPSPGNLPSFWSGNTTDGPSRLVGRREELHALADLLARSRLITLTGPGGVGKTRLALRAAGEAVPNFPDGVWLVELAGVNNGELVPTAIASALGIRVGAHATPLETLKRHLKQRSLLIVFDNCENVLATSAKTAEGLLAASPGVKILATSREALSCSAEQVLEVPPLAVPHGSTVSFDTMRSMPAVELFIERAVEADSILRIDDDDLPLVAKICSRVDGLPLAIEMVAGWVSVLGFKALDEKLHSSSDAWLHARSTAPARHTTLRATLEWSYALLSTREQAVLCRLAVFAGSFTMEAAEAVAHDEVTPNDQVFEHVASLVHKSLVARMPGVPTLRYRLLETTRPFLLEKLEASGEGDATERRRAHHVLRVLEHAKVEWETTSDTVWLKRYGPFVDDLRAAFDWAMAEDSDDAVALAGASFPLLRELSLGAEARRQLAAAAARLRPATPPVLEVRLRHGLGVSQLNTPAMASAHEELERAVALYRSLGDTFYLGTCLIPLGYSLVMLGRLAEAEQTISEALDCLENSGWLRTLATAYYVKMHIDAALERYDAANTARENSDCLCQLAGAERAGFNLAADFVQVTFEKGDVEAAVAAGRSVTARLSDTPHSDIRGFALGVLAAALTRRGDLSEALAAAREAAPLLRDNGRLFWLFDHLALRLGLAGREKDAALIAGYANAIHQKSGRPRERMGRGATEQLDGLLLETLAPEESARLAKMGALLSEDQATTLALSA